MNVTDPDQIKSVLPVAFAHKKDETLRFNVEYHKHNVGRVRDS